MANKSQLFAGNQKPDAKLSRNGFDLSCARIFSMRPAICRPVFVYDTVPNSSFKINASDIVRTDALQTAAFLRGKHELDFFFVPYSQLSSVANDVIMQRGDADNYMSAMFNTERFVQVPLCELVVQAFFPYLFYRYMLAVNRSSATFYQNIETFFVDLGLSHDQDDIYKYLLPLIYNPMPDITGLGTGTAAFQKFNQGEGICFVGSDALNLLATLRYGDYYLVAKTICDVYDEGEWRTDGDNGAVRGAFKAFLYYLKTQDRNFMMTLETFVSGQYDRTNVEKVNLHRLFAYQKCWYDTYRDSVNDDAPSYAYSVTEDFLADGESYGFFEGGIVNHSSLYLTLLKPRRRQFKKDLCNGLYSSAQYGYAGNIGLFDNSTNTSLVPGYSDPNISGGVFISSSGRPESAPTSAYAMKFAFAMQSYKEMLLRAGDRTKDVLKAEFGVKSEYINDHYVRYLGSFDGSLDLNKVSATAETGEYSVGDLAGNVFSSLSGDTIDFTCNDYGVIIGIMSFLPDPVHNAFGVDPMNVKSRSIDYYHPAFAHLGLVPVGGYQFSPLDVNGESMTATLGFGPRDYEYKQNLDLCFDGFCTAPIFPYDMSTLPSFDVRDGYRDGIHSNYVIVKDVSQSVSMLKDRIYPLPDCMDTIFKTLDGGDPESHHFQVALQVSFTAVLPMPITGMGF